MPKLPDSQGFRTLPGVMGRPQLIGGPSAEQAAIGVKQDSQLLSARQELADTSLDLELKARERVNEIRVTEAENKAREVALRLQYDPQKGLFNQKGAAALNRPSGKALADEYDEEFGKELSTMGEGLGNDVQRQAFGQVAQQLRMQMREAATKHQVSEYNSYEQQVQESAISLRVNDLVLNAKDFNKVNEAVASIEGSLVRTAQLRGLPANWVEEKKRDVLSTAHKAVVTNALNEGNLAFANRYIREYKDQLNADDLLTMRQKIDEGLDVTTGNETGRKIVDGFAPALVPSDRLRMHHITMMSESSGRRYGPDGKLLESSAGAKGEMQVLDSTNTNPGYGVKPAQDDSPEERARVGRDYLDAMLKEFNGDAAKAWAAYNWGPDNVKAAVKSAEVQGSDWFEMLPSETKNYVEKNMRMLNEGVGPVPPTELEIVNAVRATVGEARPERLKIAIEAAQKQYKLYQDSIKQREDAIVNEAFNELEANGGSYADLSPATRNALSSKAKLEVRAHAEKIKNNPDSTSNELYNELISNGEKLAALEDNEFGKLRSKLSVKDFRELQTERNKLLGRETKSPTDLPTANLNAALDVRLRSMGYNPKSTKDESEALLVANIRRYARERVFAEQTARGKQLNNLELETFVDGIFAQQANTDPSGLFNSYSGPLLQVKVSNIPTSDRAAIEDAYRARGVEEPSDEEIVRAYWYMVERKRKQGAQRDN